MSFPLPFLSLRRACALLVLAATCAHAAAGDGTDRPGQADRAAIERVVESFRTAIIARDKDRFLGLFLQDNVNWQPVLGDDSLARVRSKRPDAVKARLDPANNHRAFADNVVRSAESSEEVFSNVRIDTDGDLATVTFDYIYLAGGKETNRGKEAWILVRTESGWKISSLAYSIHLPPPAQDAPR